MENSTYWERIKTNIENLYLKKLIKENYSYDEFCNDFIPFDHPLDNNIDDKCICNHDIKYNYTYTHQKNKDQFILGSCCIKKFSTIYKNKRTCLDCNIKIKANKDNICSECKVYRKKIEKENERKLIEQKKYLDSCKCRECGYQKKDNKYKYCFFCNQKLKNK